MPTSQVAYDRLGRVTSRTDPLGNTTTTSYDLAGRITTVELADGTATRNTYDLVGRLVARSDLDTDGSVLRHGQFAYDPAGNRTSATTPLGFATTWAFDAANRMVSQVEPVSATEQITTTFGYDAEGNPTRFTDGRGNITISTFNSLGLPEQTIEPATTAHPTVADRSWTTVYDAAGQPVTLLLPGGVRRDRTFDQLGRLIIETGSGAEAPTEPRTFGYDLAGRLVSAGTPDGPQTFAYNDGGMLLSGSGPQGSASFAYDAAGRMTSRTDAAGTATFGYTPDGLLASATDPLTSATRAYTYDQARQLTQIGFGTGVRRRYTYDALHRLTGDVVEAEQPDSTVVERGRISYGYDKDSRLVSRAALDGAAEAFGYDQASRLVSWTRDATTTSYTWDAAGNRTTTGGQSATFDERNRLLTQGDASFTYDSLDRLHTAGTASFTYAGRANRPIADGTTLWSRAPAGGLLAASDAAGARVLWQDRHTDVVATVDPADGTLRSTSTFGPFGTPLTRTGPQQTLGYQAGWTSPQTGQVNMHHRWYQPATGSFTARDSVALSPTPSGNANRYAYALGNPLAYTDPTGHFVLAMASVGIALSGGELAFVGGAAIWASASLAAESDEEYVGFDALYKIYGIDSIQRATPEQIEALRNARTTGAATGSRAVPSYRIGPRIGELPFERGRWWGPRVGTGTGSGAGTGAGVGGCHGCGISLPGPRAIPRPRPQARPRWDPRTVRIPAPPTSSLPPINIRPPVDPTSITNLGGTLAAAAAAAEAAADQALLAEDLTAGEGATENQPPTTPPATCAQYPSLDVNDACQPSRPDDSLQELIDEAAEEAFDQIVEALDNLHRRQSPGQVNLYGDAPPSGIFPISNRNAFDELAKLRGLLRLPGASTEEGRRHVLARLDIAGRSIYGRNGPTRGFPGLRMDDDRSGGHAEHEVFGRAFTEGIGGGSAVLYIDRAPVCRFCRENLAGWASQLDLDRLDIVTPSRRGIWTRDDGLQWIE